MAQSVVVFTSSSAHPIFLLNELCTISMFSVSEMNTTDGATGKVRRAPRFFWGTFTRESSSVFWRMVFLFGKSHDQFVYLG